MRITPVGKSSTFDPLIKLASSRLKKPENKVEAQKKKALPAAGHDGDVIKEAVSKLDDFVTVLINNEVHFVKAMEPLSLGVISKQAQSAVSSCRYLNKVLPQLKESVNKIESAPVEELDIIDSRDSSNLINRLDKATFKLGALANSAGLAEGIGESVRNLMDEGEETFDDATYMNDLSRVYSIYAELGNLIVSAAHASEIALKDLQYIASFKKSDIADMEMVAEKETELQKNAKKSFSALDEKTKKMLQKYWKIIYPSEYIDAQFKNY